MPALREENRQVALIAQNLLGTAPIYLTGVNLTNAHALHVAVVDSSGNLFSTFATAEQQTDGSQKTQIVDGDGNVVDSNLNALTVNVLEPDAFVKRNGKEFSLKGKEFKFAGINYYPLLSSSLADMRMLLDAAAALQIPVIRCWLLEPAIDFREFVYPIGTNLITNPSFETNTSGYTLGADFTRSNTTAQDGSWSIHQVSTSGYLGINHLISVTPNTDYVWTFWYKLTYTGDGNPAHLPPTVRIENQSLADWIDDGLLENTTEWERRQVAFNSGSNSQVQLSIYNFGGNNDAYYDNWSLCLAEPAVLTYNESALVKVDQALDEARKRGIRLMFSLLDGNENNYNSKHTYVSWANAIYDAGLTDTFPYLAFFTSTYCKNLYKDFIKTLTHRINTINGIQYREDPTIFSWELGNELRLNNYDDVSVVNTLLSTNLALLSNPGGWIDEMSTFVKANDPNHLVGFGDMGHSWQYLQDNSAVGDVVFNGTYTGVSYEIAITLPNIDYLDFHIYLSHDDNINLGDGGGKYWGQAFGYNTGVSGDGVRAQLQDYADVAHENNKPALCTETGFISETTGSNTYYPLYNRYQAFKEIFKDFLDIAGGNGILPWNAVAAATSASYDIALLATGGEGTSDNTDDTDIVNLIHAYNTAFLAAVTPASPITSLIETNGDIVSLDLKSTDATVAVQLSDTWTGTVLFESTVDGITWYPQSLTDNVGTNVTSATAIGLFMGAISGMSKFRVRASASITGSLTVSIQSSVAPKLPQLSGLSLPVYDYISMALSGGNTTETYTFKRGGSGGTTVATVVVVYTDSTREVLSTVTKT